MLEDVGIAVGIDPPAPGQQVGLVFAGFGLLQRSRKFRDPDLHIEAGFGCHRLDHLRDRFGLRPLRHHEIDADRRGNTGFLQQGLGLGDVARPDRKGLLIIGMIRIDPLIAGLELAVEHDLIDCLAID